MCLWWKPCIGVNTHHHLTSFCIFHKSWEKVLPSFAPSGIFLFLGYRRRISLFPWLLYSVFSWAFRSLGLVQTWTGRFEWPWGRPLLALEAVSLLAYTFSPLKTLASSALSFFLSQRLQSRCKHRLGAETKNRLLCFPCFEMTLRQQQLMRSIASFTNDPHVSLEPSNQPRKYAFWPHSSLLNYSLEDLTGGVAGLQ